MSTSTGGYSQYTGSTSKSSSGRGGRSVNMLSPKRVKKKLQGIAGKKQKTKYDTLDGSTHHVKNTLGNGSSNKKKRMEPRVSKAYQAFHRSSISAPKRRGKKPTSFRRGSSSSLRQREPYTTMPSFESTPGDEEEEESVLTLQREADSMAKAALQMLLPRDIIFPHAKHYKSLKPPSGDEEQGNTPFSYTRASIERRMRLAIRSDRGPGVIVTLDGKDMGITAYEQKLTIACTLFVFIYLPMILVILTWHFLSSQSSGTPGVL
jgi:hypothetical protein